MESVEEMNQRLIDRYGKDVSLNNPNYRLINTAGLTEHRRGIFRDYDENGNFIREVTEVREVEKYPFYPDSWVLETLAPNLANEELLTRVSYEPVWVFGQAGSVSYPIWRAVELLVNSHKFVQRVIKSPQDLKDEEVAAFEKERELCKQIIKNESPYIAGMLADGHAVTVASDHLEPKVD